MLSHERTVKVYDLGLSKDVTSDISLTLTGSVNCSPGPEGGMTPLKLPSTAILP